MLNLISSKTSLKLLFIPIIIAEFFLSFYFNFSSFKNLPRCLNFKWLFSYFCRIIFWFAFFNIWIIWITEISNEEFYLKFFGPQFYLSYYLVIKGENWIALLAFILWLSLYYLITVKRKKLRLFNTIMLPNILMALLTFHLYAYGGPGGFFEKYITQQKGIEKVFHIDEIDNEVRNNHARGVYFDKTEQALFAMYGCTFCTEDNYPTIIRKSFQDNKINIFLSDNIRQIFFDKNSKSLFVAPWCQENFYELSMKDLSICNSYPNQIKNLLKYWEPMCIVKDLKKNRVYVGNDAETALISYNLDTGKIEKFLKFHEQGYVRIGGPVWNIIQSKKTRKLYCISGPGNNLFEIDPDTLKVIKYRYCSDIIGCALEIDDDNDILYYQNGTFDSLFEIDINSFQIKRTFTGEMHARRIRLDKKRKCIYVLGYFSGTLFPINLETGKRPWRLNVGGSAHGMYMDEDIMWVNSLAGVFKINLNIIWDSNKQ